MDRIDHKNIVEEVQDSFLDYSMSVIVARALPDLRDGLKPVHRRILYSMFDSGYTPDKQYRKCARVVGDVMGKYHPHGDSSIYEALVRMAQDFSYRHMLIDGHGNFGNMDGDGAAAMRYTESRLSKISLELLRDIKKETVDFIPNFDETEKEPSVLPSRFPNILVNGTMGIAVGMATNIPPHNLGETIDACVAYIDNHDITIPEMMEYIKGPDFPTGGIILGNSGIKKAYETGRGTITIRCKATIEEGNGRSKIVISELPYGINTLDLKTKIGELVRDKVLEGIADYHDATSIEKGVNIIITLKKEANANVVLNNLYKHTALQSTFGIIFLMLDNGTPKTLNIKEIISKYIDYQKEIIIRRTKFDLNKAEERVHILEGYKIALDNIDEVIKIVRGSRTTLDAKNGLMERFGLSDIQAQEIVDMRLRTLTGLAREELEKEYAELMETIDYLKGILADEKILLGVIKEEILIISEKYGDDRRTAIGFDMDDISIEDLIADENTVIAMSNLGYIKRMTVDNFKAQHRGGKGIKGMQTINDDFIEDLLMTTTHHYIMFITNKGRAYRLKAYEIPEAGRTARGTAIINLLQLEPGEKITAMLPIKEYVEGKFLIMATKNGIVKKTSLDEYENVRKKGLQAITLREDDELIEVKTAKEDDVAFLVTKYGKCIKFVIDDVRRTGRTSIGVRGINLDDNDEVIAMQLERQGTELLIVSENGMGKRTSVDEFSVQNRGGKGVKCYKINEKTGNVVGVKAVTDGQEIMMITNEGIIIQLEVSEISKLGRITSGVKLMDLEKKKNVRIVSIAKVRENPEGSEIIDFEEETIEEEESKE